MRKPKTLPADRWRLFAEVHSFAVRKRRSRSGLSVSSLSARQKMYECCPRISRLSFSYGVINSSDYETHGFVWVNKVRMIQIIVRLQTWAISDPQKCQTFKRDMLSSRAKNFLIITIFTWFAKWLQFLDFLSSKHNLFSSKRPCPMDICW